MQRRAINLEAMASVDDILHPSRRRFLTDAAALAGSLGLGLSLTVVPASATPETMRAALRQVVGEATLRKGRIKLDLPPLVENGNVVPLTVTVDSPMTAADHVKAIHVFNEKNPQPNVIGAYLGPRAGRASISTRIRLADTQTVTAVAELSDGTFWTDSIQVIVTLAACVENL
jgi:sulfur-oxidizing protein SoxY